MSNASKSAGFTLLEAAISITLFGTVMMGFAMAVDSLRRDEKAANADFQLARDGFAALERVGQELERTGLRAGYPQFFDDGSVGGSFASLEHMAPDISQEATARGEPTSREIVFQVPADADGDGWPDLVGSDSIAWQPVDVAFVLVPDGNGLNELRRIASDGSNRRITGNVEQVLFESPADTGFAIPLDSVRVRITVANRTASHGRVSRRTFQAVYQMHNGDPIP